MHYDRSHTAKRNGAPTLQTRRSADNGSESYPLQSGISLQDKSQLYLVSGLFFPPEDFGIFPVEHRGGQWIINNYYVAPTGKEQETFQALLEAVKTFAADQQEVTAIVQTPHKDYFTAYAFKPVKEWKAYLKMRLNEQTEHQEECI